MYLHHIVHCTIFFLGIGTKIEPTLCRADRLVGQVPPDKNFSLSNIINF